MVAAYSPEYLAIVVHGVVYHLWPELVALRWQTDMFSSIPATSVHTQAFQFLNISLELLLHAAVLGLQVHHAYLAVGHLIAAAVVGIAVVVVEVGVLPEVGHPVEVAVGVVGHHVNYYLHSESVGSVAECLKVGRRSECVWSGFRVAWAIENVPVVLPGIVALGRRGLHGNKAGSLNLAERSLDVAVFPVKAMEYYAIADFRGQRLS